MTCAISEDSTPVVGMRRNDVCGLLGCCRRDDVRREDHTDDAAEGLCDHEATDRPRALLAKVPQNKLRMAIDGLANLAELVERRPRARQEVALEYRVVMVTGSGSRQRVAESSL